MIIDHDDDYGDNHDHNHQHDHVVMLQRCNVASLMIDIICIVSISHHMKNA